MPAERYFIDQQIVKGNEILLEETEFHHLVRVMRTKEGETVEVVNGKGFLAEAVVSRIAKRNAALEINSVYFETSSKCAYTLFQAIPRMNRLDTIVEKCTELGIAEICLWPAVQSERKEISDHQLQRLRSVAISAMKQCGRLYLPPITILPEIGLWEPFAQEVFFGDVHPEAPLFIDILQGKKLDQAIFIIGPESGFTDEEAKQMLKKGFIGVKLHKNILRTDTAAIVAVSFMTHYLV